MISPIGVCHGFEVHSSLPHRFLNSGSGKKLLVGEVAYRAEASGVQLITWPAREGRLETSIYDRGDGRFDVSTQSIGVIEVDAQSFQIGVPNAAEPVRREMLTFGTPAAILISHAGDIAFHGACLRFDSGAFLLTGPGGSGKSTLTAAAVGNGFQVLSDDLIRIDPSAKTVHPGPAVVRLREESLGLVDLTGMRIAAEIAGKTHLLLPPGPPGPVSLSAIAVLRRGSTFRIERLRPDAAVPALWEQTFFLPDGESRTKCFSNLVEVVDKVPVFTLTYPHLPSSISPTLKALTKLGGMDA